MSSTLALIVWLTAAGQTPEAVEPVAEPTVEAAPPVGGDVWPGEERRVHWGLGARYHLGLMLQLGSFQLVSEAGIYGLFSLRTFGHQELRVQAEINGGIPDLFGGETVVSYRTYLKPWLSVGGALVFFIGAPSLRVGAEVPVAVRLGKRRQHEISASLRFTGGVFNNTTFVWFDVGRQRPAGTGEITVGYTYLF